MSQDPRVKFVKALAVLADMCQFQLKPEMIAIYVQDIEPHGLDKACAALRVLFRGLRPGKSFPSINEILAAMGSEEESDEARSRDAAARIVAAIPRLGYSVNAKHELRVAEWVGPIAWEVIRLQGGWNQVCEMLTNDNVTQLQAQWRNLAESVCGKARSGMLGLPSEMPNEAIAPGNPVHALIEGLANSIAKLPAERPDVGAMLREATRNM